MKRQQRDSGLIVAVCVMLGLCLVLYVIGFANKPLLTANDRNAAVGVRPDARVDGIGRAVDPSVYSGMQETGHPVKSTHGGVVALFDAIRQVESGGDSHAVGDDGRSRGPVQCSRAAWIDACEEGGLDWDYDTYVYSWPHCQQIMKLYFQRYNAITNEQAARIWNGGPRGMSKESTKVYWDKVKAILERN